MPRYYLKNPKNDADILVQRGQSWDQPIYKGKDSNDYYILKWGSQFNLQLFPFDPNIGQIAGEAFDVPENWTGEPRVIGIDEDLWNSLPALAQTNINAEALLSQLLKDLIEGDSIRLISDGQNTGYLRARRQGGQWTLVRA